MLKQFDLDWYESEKAVGREPVVFGRDNRPRRVSCTNVRGTHPVLVSDDEREQSYLTKRNGELGLYGLPYGGPDDLFMEVPEPAWEPTDEEIFRWAKANSSLMYIDDADGFRRNYHYSYELSRAALIQIHALETKLAGEGGEDV